MRKRNKNTVKPDHPEVCFLIFRITLQFKMSVPPRFPVKVEAIGPGSSKIETRNSCLEVLWLKAQPESWQLPFCQLFADRARIAVDFVQPVLGQLPVP